MNPCRICGGKTRHKAECPKKKQSVVCPNCGNPKGVKKQRGLCDRCYSAPEIREKYPPLGKPRTYSQLNHEPTIADLDAMIAEQMKPENLPPWWEDAAEQQDNPLFQTVRRPDNRRT